MWEDYWTPFSDDSSWWDGGGGVDSWDLPFTAENYWGFDSGSGTTFDFGGFGDAVEPGWGDGGPTFPSLVAPQSFDFGGFGDAVEPGWGAGGGINFPSLVAPQFVFPEMGNLLHNANAMGPTGMLAQSAPTVPLNTPSNMDTGAQVANLPLHAYDDWKTGSGYRSDWTLDTLNPSQYGSQLPPQPATSWEKRLGAMADKIVGRLPDLAMYAGLSALVPDKGSKLQGEAMRAMTNAMDQQNQHNAWLSKAYQQNVPVLQNQAMGLAQAAMPQQQAIAAYNAAKTVGAAGLDSLRRRLRSSGATPEGRAAAEARYMAGQSGALPLAYNTGLLSGFGNARAMQDSAHGMFAQPNYAGSGAMAYSAGGLAGLANRDRMERLAGMAGLLGGYDEGKEEGLKKKDYTY